MRSYPTLEKMFVLTIILLLLLPTMCLGFSLSFQDSSPSAPAGLESWPGLVPPPPTQNLDIPPDPHLNQALALANSGKLSQALEQVNQVLKQNPGSTPALELQGAILALQGQTDAGLKALQEAVRLNPRQSSALTKIGDIFLTQGKFKEAQAQFFKAIQANPDYARAHQRLGLLLEKEGKAPAAIAHFEKGLVGTPPDYVGTKVNLARLYNLTHRFDKTVALLANRIPPGNQGFLLHVLLAAAYLGQKHAALAQAEFDRALKLAQPDVARAYLALGIADREAGLNEDSRKALKQAITLQPNQAMPYWELGKTLAALKKPDAAIDQVRRAVQLDPKNPELKKGLAVLLLEQKKFPEAIAICQELLRAPNAGPGDYDFLASAYQAAGQFDQAEKIFLQRVQKYPQDPLSYYHLGLFYGFIRKYDLAITQLNQGLKIAPHNLALLQALTMAYQRLGELNRAIETNKKIVNLDPENMAQKFNLAFLYKKSGQVSDAAAIYREILTKNPDEIAALNNLAQLLGEIGKLSEAEPMAVKAAALAPENGHVLDTLGWIKHKQQHPQEALNALERAAYLLPDDPEVLYHLGVVLDEQGKKPDARQYLEKALGLSKDFPGADQAEKLLQKLPPTTKK